MIGDVNREGMKGDSVSIVIQVGGEDNEDGCVYYYVNREIQPIAIRDIPSVVYFSLSLSSHSSVHFISHDIYHHNAVKLDQSKTRYYHFPSLTKTSSDEIENILSSSSLALSTSSSPLSTSPSLTQDQPYPRYNYPSLSFLQKQTSQEDETTQFSTDYFSVSSYNIPHGLCGLGEAIHNHIIHESSDPKDVISLLVSSRRISKVLLNKEFGWAVSHCSSLTYSLRDVPVEKVDIV